MIGHLSAGSVVKILGVHHRAHGMYGLHGDTPAKPTADPAVKDLQESLKKLAVAAGNPAIDPGAATGLVDATLLIALTAAQNAILAKVDRTTSILVTAAFAALAIADASDVEAKVKQYAAAIATAVKVATAAIIADKSPSGGGGGTPSGGYSFIPVKATYIGPPSAPPPSAANQAASSVLDLFKTGGQWSPVKLGGAALLGLLAYSTFFAKK